MADRGGDGCAGVPRQDRLPRLRCDRLRGGGGGGVSFTVNVARLVTPEVSITFNKGAKRESQHEPWNSDKQQRGVMNHGVLAK